MRIAFLGPLNFDRWTLFISTYFTSLATAIGKQGHATRLFSYYEMWQHPWFSRRYGRIYAALRARFGKVVDYPYEILLHGNIEKRLREYRPDAVLLHFVGGSYYPRLLNKLRKLDTPLLAWLGVHPSGKEPFISEDVKVALRMTDCLLYYDPAYEPIFRKEGFKRVRRLPFGIDFDVYDSVEPDEALKDEGLVSFIGQIYRQRAEYLRALSRFPLGIWTYDRDSLKREGLERYYKGEASGNRLIAVMKSAPIVLNVHRESEISGGNYRLFEIASARSCQIVDYRPGIGEYFEPELEVVTFKNKTELESKTKELWHNPGLRKSIAEAGYRRAKKDHSIDKRVLGLLEILKDL